MPYYEWRDLDDPESDAQMAFVNSYIREHFGAEPEDWCNGLSEALGEYWKTCGIEDDPEEHAFIFPCSTDILSALEEVGGVIIPEFGSVEFEGFILDPRIEELSRQQALGIIDGDQARREILKMHDTN